MSQPPPSLPSQPDPALPRRPNHDFDRRTLLLFALGLGCVAILILLRAAGWVIPFSIPYRDMAPALSPGDHIFMEGLSFLVRKPRRGEIVVFRNNVPGLGLAFRVKRIAGLPGEHLRIVDGRLYINDNLVVLTNASG